MSFTTMQMMVFWPCLPTISATCSELGTGTHSVIFCDFLERSSTPTLKAPSPVGLPKGWLSVTDPKGSLKPNIDNSNASCSALCSSSALAVWSISENKLDGISTNSIHCLKNYKSVHYSPLILAQIHPPFDVKKIHYFFLWFHNIPTSFTEWNFETLWRIVYSRKIY